MSLETDPKKRAGWPVINISQAIQMLHDVEIFSFVPNTCLGLENDSTKVIIMLDGRQHVGRKYGTQVRDDGGAQLRLWRALAD